MEDHCLATTCQCHLQGIEAELRVKAEPLRGSPGLRKLQAEHVSEAQIHDLRQVEEYFLQRDGGDLCRPDLVRCPNMLEIHQIGKSLGWHGGAEGLTIRM